MSIIERVGELLGSFPKPDREPSAADEGADGLEQNRIERAVDAISRRSDFPEDKDLAEESKAKARPARPASTTTRTLRIDLDQLRRQSMITPDGERTPIAEGFRRIKRQN